MLLEIADGLLDGSEKFAIGIRRERTVCDAFDVELSFAKSEEFAIHPDAQVRVRG